MNTTQIKIIVDEDVELAPNAVFKVRKGDLLSLPPDMAKAFISAKMARYANQQPVEQSKPRRIQSRVKYRRGGRSHG